MTHMIDYPSCPDNETRHELNLDDTTGVGERFKQGFQQFIQSKKHQAVVNLLKDELPHLADDPKFIEKVMNRLGDDAVEEKRFVFLVLNQNLTR